MVAIGGLDDAMVTDSAAFRKAPVVELLHHLAGVDILIQTAGALRAGILRVGQRLIDKGFLGRILRQPLLIDPLGLSLGGGPCLVRDGGGAILGGGTDEQVESAGQYGYYLGLAFQVVDDILDVTATAEELGKPVGSDDENEKNTYVSLLGIGRARELAVSYTAQAKAALEGFSDGADLCRLADALLTRTH